MASSEWKAGLYSHEGEEQEVEEDEDEDVVVFLHSSKLEEQSLRKS